MKNRYNKLFFLAVGVFLLAVGCKNNPKQTKPETTLYEPTWESLKEVPIPQWYEDAKFGIMIHWGPYSVLAEIPKGKGHYSEHLASNMYRDKGYDSILLKRFCALPPEFGYKDMIPLFKGEKFDADQWLDLFVRAGAKYIIPVAEHHDGFAMWDSELTTWDAMDKGPRRDVIGELAVATRKRGLKFAPSFHRERHNTYFTTVKNEGGPPLPVIEEEIKRMPEAAELYGPFEMTDTYMEDFAARWAELCEKYRPDFYWLDDYPDYNEETRSIFMRHQRKIIADYINLANTEWKKEVYFNNKGKNNNYPDGVGIREADNMHTDDLSVKWQNPATLGVSYGYRKIEELQKGWVKPPRELIHLLIEVVSKNGNLLMNVGPRPDGTIPESQQEALIAMGDWLSQNGESIYSTRAWKTSGEGRIRFTVNNNTLYAILLDCQEEEKILLKTLKGWTNKNIKQVVKIDGGELKYELKSEGLLIQLPKNKSSGYTYIVKIICNKDVNQLPYTKIDLITEDLHTKHKRRILGLEHALSEDDSTDY